MKTRWASVSYLALGSLMDTEGRYPRKKNGKKKKKTLSAFHHKTAKLNFAKEHEKNPDKYLKYVGSLIT